MKLKALMYRPYWLFSAQFGIDPRRTLRSLRGLPRYIRDLFRFRAAYTGRLELRPCLHDWYEEGGTTKNEYFLQDLHVARKIFAAQPEKHVDVGSRIDGFVAHVASFREIEVFDIRPIAASIPGVKFRQADMSALSEQLVDYCDSLSCLHALEHFGLGRYGDPIDPEGYVAGMQNMATLLRPGGAFYLSAPVGIATVRFNANRIFDPMELVKLAACNGLVLKGFAWIDSNQNLAQSANPDEDMKKLSRQSYFLAIFTFTKQ